MYQIHVVAVEDGDSVVEHKDAEAAAFACCSQRS